MIFTPGFYQDIAFRDYLADPAINNSGLKIFSQSPAKFAYWQDNDKPGTSTQIEGSALHCLILQPELFEAYFGKTEAPRKGSAGRDKWDAQNPTAIPLTPGQWNNVRGMASAFPGDCTIARELLEKEAGTPELSVFFDDPGTSLRCKIRPDFLGDDNVIIDLKSTKNASPTGFLGEIMRWGYHYQAAFYVRGVNAAFRDSGVKRQVRAFIIVAVENFAPHEVATYMIPSDMIRDAQQQIDTNLARYAECLLNGVWPSYPNKIMIPGEQGGDLYD